MNTANTEVDQEIVTDQEKAEAVSHDTNNDTGYTPEISEQQAPIEEEQGEAQKPVDARQETLDKITDRVEQDRISEKEAIDASYEKPAPVVQEQAPSEDDFVDLKVRKQTHRMTIKDRNDLLIEEHGAEEVAEMTEREKNRFAQFAVAQKQYSDELNKVKTQVNEASKVQPQQQFVQPVAEAAPVEPEKTRVQLAEDAIKQAIEDQSIGIDGSSERLSEAYVELAKATAVEEANQRDTERQTQMQDQSFNKNLKAGYDAGNAALEAFNPEFAKTPSARGMLDANYDHAFRMLILEEIGKGGSNSVQAFANNGITAESLNTIGGSHLAKLYKDMKVKGYNMPPPSQVMPAVANNLIAQLQTNTQSAPSSQQQGQNEGQQQLNVDRQERKSAIQNQPGRVAIPSNSNPPQKSVQTPSERHKAALKEERAARGRKQVR